MSNYRERASITEKTHQDILNEITKETLKYSDPQMREEMFLLDLSRSYPYKFGEGFVTKDTPHVLLRYFFQEDAGTNRGISMLFIGVNENECLLIIRDSQAFDH